MSLQTGIEYLNSRQPFPASPDIAQPLFVFGGQLKSFTGLEHFVEISREAPAESPGG